MENSGDLQCRQRGGLQSRRPAGAQRLDHGRQNPESRGDRGHQPDQESDLGGTRHHGEIGARIHDRRRGGTLLSRSRLDMVSPLYLWNERSWKELQERRKRQRRRDGARRPPVSAHFGTVGAVALDSKAIWQRGPQQVESPMSGPAASAIRPSSAPAPMPKMTSSPSPAPAKGNSSSATPSPPTSPPA